MHNPDEREAALDRAEWMLACDPAADALWRDYTSLLANAGSEMSDRRQLANHCLRCLRSAFVDPNPLNDVTEYFERRGQPFNAALCRAASLAADPAQGAVYRKLDQDFDRGFLTPAAFVPSEPVSCTVSVILATQDRPSLLREALGSVLDQTFPDFEVLVINDGGTSAAEEVVKSYGSHKVRYFWKERGGHRSAMNLGLRVARGKYIGYLDDDDVYLPHHLETLVQPAESGGLDFVSSRNRWVVGRWEDGKWCETRDLTTNEPFSIERLHVGAVIADLTVLHTRRLAERVGLFWEEPPRGGEWEYWVRCSHHTEIRRLETITGEVRVLSSTLPLNQPARARFFTELWRTYFGSGFGRAIHSAAAWHDNKHEICWCSLQSLDGFWPHLNDRVTGLLWPICQSDNLKQRDYVWSNLGRFKQGWLLNRVVGMKSGKSHLHLRNLPWRVGLGLAGFACRQPLRVVSKLKREFGPRHRKGPTATDIQLETDVAPKS